MTDEQKALAERKSELLARKAAKEAEIEARKEALTVQLLELEEKYDLELGTRGIDYEIVDITDCSKEHPFLVLKLGERIFHKRFVALSDDKKGLLEEQQNFVAPCCVVPGPEKFRELSNVRPGIADRAGIALLRLYGHDLGAKAGK